MGVCPAFALFIFSNLTNSAFFLTSSCTSSFLLFSSVSPLVAPNLVLSTSFFSLVMNLAVVRYSSDCLGMSVASLSQSVNACLVHYKMWVLGIEKQRVVACVYKYCLKD